MQENLGQLIALENKLGASGMLALAELAWQPADGYTLLVLPSPTVAAYSLFPKVPLTLRTDIVPIGQINAVAAVPQVAVKAWHGIIALKGTPREATDRLGKELAAVLAEPALQRRMIEGQSEPAKGDRASFANLIEVELTLWADVIRQAGITLEK